jgi:taurine ABC transporter substrate-binding protein
MPLCYIASFSLTPPEGNATCTSIDASQIAALALLAFLGHHHRCRRQSPSPYQTGVDPAKVAQADGLYEKATGARINWRKFDAGAEVLTAIASGDVQIGYVGSSPIAAAASKGLPVVTFLVAAQLGGSEALVVRNGSKIAKPEDLIGKKIAVPFVSTGHYSLLAALKHWKIDPSKVQIINLRPPEITAAWQRGDIDATYGWDPALGKAKESGKVLATSADVGKWGAPTFDGWIVRRDFAEKNPDFVTRFARGDIGRVRGLQNQSQGLGRKRRQPRQGRAHYRCQEGRHCRSARGQRLSAGQGADRSPRQADREGAGRHRQLPQGTGQGG